MKNIILFICFIITFGVYSQNHYVVTSTNDPVNPFNTVPGELRWAIEQANANIGLDYIDFNITTGTPALIQLNSYLPPLIDQIVIDGNTQPVNGYTGIEPKIILEGSLTGSIPGLQLINSNGSEIVNIRFQEFPLVAIDLINTSYNLITDNVFFTQNQHSYRSVTFSDSDFNTIITHDNKFYRNNFGVNKGLNSFVTNNSYGIVFDQHGTIGHSNNFIGGATMNEANYFYNCSEVGILTYAGIQNKISHNYFIGNSANIGQAPNGKPCGGGNLCRTPPIISQAQKTGSSSLLVNGTTISANTDTIEIYKSNNNGIDAIEFLGYAVANAAGNWTTTFTSTISTGDKIIATATDVEGNTSPFSLPINVTTSTQTCCTNIFPIASLNPLPSEEERSGNSTTYFCDDQPLYLSLGSCNCDNTNVNDFTWNITTVYSNGTTAITTQTGCNPMIAADTSVVTYIITVDQTCDGSINHSPDLTINMLDCEPPPCETCIPSFTPLAGKTYIIGAWVKDDDYDLDHSMTTFTDPQIVVDFPGASTYGPFTASGLIIDGWQRVEQEFTVPSNASTIDIKLLSVAGECYFDDIRIFPKDGSMKSYVYDPVTLRLMAELDERNYATFYEYDEEGKLTRVKKETERGVMTIKEAKNSLIKK